MLRMSRWLTVLVLAGGWSSAPAAQAAGFENFDNFPVSGGSYSNGTFPGQDGSTWTFVQCRGDQIITPLRTPTLARNKNPAAAVRSGTLSNGCGTLSFDWMRPFASTCNFEVLVNTNVVYISPGGELDLTNHEEIIGINVGGNFWLEFRQRNLDAGQAAIDNIRWTSFGAAPPTPPGLALSTNASGILTAYGKLIQFDVTANEPNADAVQLWAAGLPAGAAFPATHGLAPLRATFSWTPAAAQTGAYSIVFQAGDKDGTNTLAFAIDVTPIYPYYHYAEGLAGAALKAKLHDIISADAVQLDNLGEDAAMQEIHTDPANTNNVRYLYNTNASVPKSAYQENGGWNKEHCWPESRGLGGEGPDQVDVHNLYAEDIKVNNLRAALYFDESATNDTGYRNPATNTAPQTSLDADSFAPPPASKGNVARAIFYMATRYDGSEPETEALYFDDHPAAANLPAMGMLKTLLLWHAMDPPDDWEKTRNELIFSKYQHNRNPFVDRPEWVELIWGTDSDGDGVTDTHELIAGTATNNPDSVFTATLAGTQVTCGALSSGSVWRLYQGVYSNQDIVWRRVAETNRLQGGQVTFPVAPTDAAAFYHLRALRP